jgi:hypothetical protein
MKFRNTDGTWSKEYLDTKWDLHWKIQQQKVKADAAVLALNSVTSSIVTANKVISFEEELISMVRAYRKLLSDAGEQGWQEK